MNQGSFKKHREPRVSRAFMVRINEDVAVQNPSWNIVMAQNISASGILFNFDHYLAPGARVQFKIALPVGADVECDGQVVRNVMGSSQGRGSPQQAVSAVAAVFRNITKEDRLTIREFIQQNLPASGAVKRRPVFSSMSPSGKKPRARRIDRAYVARIRKEKSGEWEMVALRNISETGILFNYGRVLEIGRELSFSIVLPFSAIPAECGGKIVRVKDETRPGALVKTYTVGVSFSGLDETSRKGLRQYGEQIGRD